MGEASVGTGPADRAAEAAGPAAEAAGPAAEAPGPDLLLQEILIPGGHGAAFAARAGQLVEIVDLEGQQVADFVAPSPLMIRILGPSRDLS